MHLVRAVAKLSSKGNNLPYHEFCNTARVRKGRIEDGDTIARCKLEVNLICADTKAADDEQILRFAEDAFRKFRLRPNADYLDITKSAISNFLYLTM